jgi:hypothetical protein
LPTRRRRCSTKSHPQRYLRKRDNSDNPNNN